MLAIEVFAPLAQFPRAACAQAYSPVRVDKPAPLKLPPAPLEPQFHPGGFPRAYTRLFFRPEQNSFARSLHDLCVRAILIRNSRCNAGEILPRDLLAEKLSHQIQGFPRFRQLEVIPESVRHRFKYNQLRIVSRAQQCTVKQRGVA